MNKYSIQCKETENTKELGTGLPGMPLNRNLNEARGPYEGTKGKRDILGVCNKEQWGPEYLDASG